MLHLRATNLEKFRRFLMEVSEYETEESLMEILTGVFAGNEYTRIGTAFHKICELGDVSKKFFQKVTDAEVHEKSIIDIDGNKIIFNQSQINMAVAYKNEFQGSFNEIRASKVYLINGTEISVSGGADKIFGNQIRDTKTKYSYIKSIADYTDSIQWKLYCDIFELPEFYFDVFEFKGYDKAKHGYDVSCLTLVKHEPIHCIEYSGMQNDIQVLLTQFVEFIKFRKIENLFTQPLKIKS